MNSKSIFKSIKNGTFIQKCLSHLYSFTIKSVLFLFTPFIKINKKKIVLCDFGGKAFGGNPKYIAEMLLNSKETLDLVWVSKKKCDLPSGIRWAKYGSLSGAIEFASGAVWIDSIRNTERPKKKKDQIYLQTWHGPYSPKFLEKAAENDLPKYYVRAAKYDGSITNAIISSSKHQTDQYKKYFWLNESVEYLSYGLPRNDYLIRNKNNLSLINEIRNKLGISCDDYIVLYTPTFRDDYSMSAYDLDYMSVMDTFYKRFGKRVFVLVRFHPNIRELVKKNDFFDRCIDVTEYDDIQELILISNCNITDYSTTAFDCALIGKPVFLFSLDLENYQQYRGLEKEYYSLPFPRAESNDQLKDIISNYNDVDYSKRVQEYFKKYPLYDDGHASEQCAKWVLKKMEDLQ